MNLFKFRNGGVYKIVCLKNGKLYYGQTSCFIRRCYQHLSFLKEKKHSCIELQKDVNRYGLDAFVFEVSEVESQLAKRLKLEKNGLLKLCSSSQTCSHVRTLRHRPPQNFYTIQPPHFIIFQQSRVLLLLSVKILGLLYPSIAEAARLLGKSSRTIRMKLDDPLNLNYYERLEYHRAIYFDEYEVNVDGQNYRSTFDSKG
jgi:predicted GIY-YIG superfamily endonuclease